MMYKAQYNNHDAEDYGLFVVKRPAIPSPVRKVEYTEIPGRSGSLTRDYGTYSNIEISVQFNFMSDDSDTWQASYRQAKKWLKEIGNFELSFSDDPEYFYIVKNVTIDSTERTSLRIGNFAAKFTCDPYQYFYSGKKEITLPASLYNPDDVAEPTYTITGTGVCTITRGGSAVILNVESSMTLDCSRRMAYRTGSGEPQNTYVTGDYEDLFLQPGQNDFTITSGFACTIVPNWRSI